MDKKKVILIVLLIGLGVCLGVAGAFLFPKKEELEEENPVDDPILHWNESMEVGVYEKAMASSFVSIEEGGVIEDYEIDTTQLGEHEEVLHYEDANGKKYKTTFKVTVKDLEEPLIGVGKTYTFIKGSSRGLDELIMCADNYDPDPLCEIQGEYDLNKLGSYDVVYYAKDSSGNEAREPFTLKVAEKYDTTTKSSISLDDAKSKYLSDNSEIGIDVSKWQGNIDWNKVKEAGVTFAFLRIGTQKGPNLDSTIDTYFKKNIENAKKAGVKVGVYYYTYAGTKEDAKAQADWVIEQLEGEELDLPIVFDWECYSYFNSFNISLYNLNEIADTFLQEVKSKGYRPMVYASKNYLQKVWKYLDYPTWLAHYTEKTDYEGNYQYWQFTDTGRVPGIDGDVDIDIYYR